MERAQDSKRPLNGNPNSDSEFPNAPDDWTPSVARALAQKERLTLDDDHWDVIRALQSYYARNRETAPQLPEIKQALEEKFHHKGGGRHLQEILPGGPVAQGCRLAGLKAPAGAVDKGFGSVA